MQNAAAGDKTPRFGKACIQTMLERALDLCRRTLGANHFQVSFDCAALGRVLAGKGKLEEARGMFEEGIRIREANVGANKIRTGELLASLGRLYLLMGDAGAACRTLQRALRIHVQAYGPAHSDTLQTAKNLADALLLAAAMTMLSRLSGKFSRGMCP
jgi:tetratricopeptide (TPR) repeat protein